MLMKAGDSARNAHALRRMFPGRCYYIAAPCVPVSALAQLADATDAFAGQQGGIARAHSLAEEQAPTLAALQATPPRHRRHRTTSKSFSSQARMLAPHTGVQCACTRKRECACTHTFTHAHAPTCEDAACTHAHVCSCGAKAPSLSTCAHGRPLAVCSAQHSVLDTQLFDTVLGAQRMAGKLCWAAGSEQAVLGSGWQASCAGLQVASKLCCSAHGLASVDLQSA